MILAVFSRILLRATARAHLIHILSARCSTDVLMRGRAFELVPAPSW